MRVRAQWGTWGVSTGTLARAACCLLLPAIAASGAARLATADDVGSSPCRAQSHGRLSARLVERGAPLVVDTVVRWSCPARARPYHLVIVADVAAAAVPGVAMDVRVRLADLLDRVGLPYNQRMRLGVVAFGAGADTRCGLSADARALARCLDDLTLPAPDLPEGRSGLGAGIHEAVKALDLAYEQRETDDPLRQGVLLLVGADSAHDCRRVDAALAEAARASVDVAAVCLAEDCAAACLPPDTVPTFAMQEWDVVAEGIETTAWRSSLRVTRIAMDDFLDPTLRLDASTLDAASSVYVPSDHHVSTRVDVRRFGLADLRTTYVVAPTAAGRFAVRRSSSALLFDSHGGIARFELPALDVVVADGQVQRSFLPRLSQWIGARPAPTSPPKTLQ